jgi:hypothetical protein
MLAIVDPVAWLANRTFWINNQKKKKKPQFLESSQNYEEVAI